MDQDLRDAIARTRATLYPDDVQSLQPSVVPPEMAQARSDSALDGIPAPAPAFAPIVKIANAALQPSAPAPAPAFAPIVKIANAGWQPSTRSEQRQLGMSEEEMRPALDAMNEAHFQRRLANQDEMEVARQRGEAQAAYAAGAQDVAQRHAERQAALQSERDAYVKRELDTLNKSAAELNAKVDPDQYWKSKGTLGQVGAAIMMGLGQFGASMNGGENAVMKIFDRAVDANIKAQEQEIASRRDKFNAQKSNYASNLEAFGDRDRAILAEKVNALDVLKTQLDAQVAKLGTDEARVNGQKIEAQIYEKRAQYMSEFAEKTHTKVVQADNEAWRPAQYAGGAGNRKAADNLVFLADGTAASLPNEKIANDVRTKAQAASQLLALDMRARILRKTAEAADPGTAEHETAMAQLEKMATERVYTESIAKGQGVVRDQEMERELEHSPYLKGLGSRGMIMGRLSRLNPFRDRDLKAGDNLIDASIDRAQRDQEAIVRGSGGTIVKPGFARDASGNLVPTAQETGQFVQPDNPLAPEHFKPLAESGDVVPTKGAPLGAQLPAAPVVQAGAPAPMPLPPPRKGGSRGR